MSKQETRRQAFRSRGGNYRVADTGPEKPWTVAASVAGVEAFASADDLDLAIALAITRAEAMRPLKLFG